MSNKAKVCRICMLGNIKGVISLFTLCDGTVKIYNKVMEVANIQISREDGLPTWICYTCLIHLETSYQFKVQAEKSDQLFKKQLDTTNNEDMKKMAIYTNEDPLQNRSHLRELLIEPKPSDKSFVGSDSINQDYFTNIQSGLQGHFLSEVFDVNDCSPVINSEEQNGIKITSVVSQAKPEGIEIEDSLTNPELVDTSDNDTQVVGTPSKESVCTCTEDKDGINISKCDVCTKMSSDHGTTGDVNNSINSKTYQSQETSSFDMVVSKDCINRIIENIERQEQCLSPKSFNARNSSQRKNSVYSCTKCGDHFGETELIVIRKQKSISRFECHICDRYFAFKETLDTHLLIHTGVTNPYKCNLCEFACNSNRKLRHHMVVHKGVKPYKCDVCAKAFVTEKKFNVHTRTHSSKKLYKCELCDKIFVNRGVFSSHKITHLDVLRYKCNYCDKSYKYKGGLTLHNQVHHTGMERKYICELCGKSFMLRATLVAHKSTHPDGKPKECDICNKTFLHKRALVDHKRSVHIQNTVYQCEYCGNNFNNSSALKRHIKSHSDEQKYKCNICALLFTQKSTLKTHTKVIHAGIKPYSCQLCGQTFKWKQTFDKHKLKCVDKQ